MYTITDVLNLNIWMVEHLDNHPLFERITKEEEVFRIILCFKEQDPCIPHVVNSTEEGKKVDRNNNEKYLAVYRRIKDPFE